MALSFALDMNSVPENMSVHQEDTLWTDQSKSV